MGGIFRAIFGGGGSSHPSSAPAPAQAATSAAGGGVPSGTSADDYRRQSEAYYNQMLAGLGQGTPGGGLPQGIQENIDRQAALIK